MRRYFFDQSKVRAKVIERQFVDRVEALRFLNEEKASHDTVSELRYWYARQGRMPQSDRELMEYCATALTTGLLHVYERVGSGPSSQDNSPQVDETANRPSNSTGERFTPSAMRGRTSSVQPSSTKTPKSSIDVERQILALQAAAESGAPFCEQCNK
jgi:hypothetical protein